MHSLFEDQFPSAAAVRHYKKSYRPDLNLEDLRELLKALTEDAKKGEFRPKREKNLFKQFGWYCQRDSENHAIHVEYNLWSIRLQSQKFYCAPDTEEGKQAWAGTLSAAAMLHKLIVDHPIQDKKLSRSAFCLLLSIYGDEELRQLRTNEVFTHPRGQLTLGEAICSAHISYTEQYKATYEAMFERHPEIAGQEFCRGFEISDKVKKMMEDPSHRHRPNLKTQFLIKALLWRKHLREEESISLPLRAKNTKLHSWVFYYLELPNRKLERALIVLRKHHLLATKATAVLAGGEKLFAFVNNAPFIFPELLWRYNYKELQAYFISGTDSDSKPVSAENKNTPALLERNQLGEIAERI